MAEVKNTMLSANNRQRVLKLTVVVQYFLRAAFQKLQDGGGVVWKIGRESVRVKKGCGAILFQSQR